MLKQILGILMGVAVMGASGTTSAAVVVAQYDFAGNTLASSDTDGNSIASDIDASGMPLTVASETFDIKDPDVNGGGYLYFTLAPGPGYTLDLASLSFTAQRSKTQGDVTIEVASSLDGFASPLFFDPPLSTDSYVLGGTTSVTTFTIDLSAFGPIGDTGSITFRLNFQSPGTAASRVTSIDDITVDGTATPVQLPPAAWLMGSGLLGLIGIGRRPSA